MTSLDISSRSGRVEIVAEARSDVAVDGADDVRESGDHVTVSNRSRALTVRCPIGTDVRIGVQSGRVSTSGELGDVRVTSASGSIEVEHASMADLRSASGSVTVGACVGPCRVAVSSGSVIVGRAASVDASTRSGSVEVGPVDAAEVRVASGSVRLSATGEGDVEISTRSGSVVVNVPRESCPACDIKTRGTVEIEPEQGDAYRLTIRARSGGVRVEAG